VQFQNGNSGSIEALFYEGHNKFMDGRKHRLTAGAKEEERLPEGLDPSALRGVEGVYVIASGCGETVKIGRTTNIESRLRSLQTGHAYELTIRKFFVCRESRRLEAVLHAFLGDHRMMGEWFHSPALFEVENLDLRSFGAYEYKPGITTADKLTAIFEPRVPMPVKVDIETCARANGVNNSQFVRAIITNWASQPESLICSLPAEGTYRMRMRTSHEQKALIMDASRLNDISVGQIVTSAMHLFKQHTDPNFSGWPCAPVLH
jgi:hypothetical protein